MISTVCQLVFMFKSIKRLNFFIVTCASWCVFWFMSRLLNYLVKLWSLSLNCRWYIESSTWYCFKLFISNKKLNNYSIIKLKFQDLCVSSKFYCQNFTFIDCIFVELTEKRIVLPGSFRWKQNSLGLTCDTNKTKKKKIQRSFVSCSFTKRKKNVKF